VKFIYTKGPINTSEQISAIHVDTIKSEPAGQVERIAFLINKAQRNNPLSVLDLLQAIRIVPAHVFEPLIAEKGLDEVKKLTMDKNPVVSGPYNIMSADPNKIILLRRDDYWGNAALHNGKLPAPKYVVHPIYKSNEHNTIALRKGELDASMSFIPRIGDLKGAGVHTWLNEAPFFTRVQCRCS
jgi:peptide/nickel transport system substrate-binding protein